MSNPDERHQATTILLLGVALCLWVSHKIILYFPSLPGTIDLRQWIRFWNKPIIVNWPSAAVLFIMGWWFGKRIRREAMVRNMRCQQEEARWLKKQVSQSNDGHDDYHPIE